MQFWSSTKSIHATAYGMYVTSGGTGTGAWWDQLTSSSIRVRRDTDDNIVEKVRVRIWVVE
jgi:hypothetical protein